MIIFAEINAWYYCECRGVCGSSSPVCCVRSRWCSTRNTCILCSHMCGVMRWWRWVTFTQGATLFTMSSHWGCNCVLKVQSVPVLRPVLCTVCLSLYLYCVAFRLLDACLFSRSACIPVRAFGDKEFSYVSCQGYGRATILKTAVAAAMSWRLVDLILLSNIPISIWGSFW